MFAYDDNGTGGGAATTAGNKALTGALADVVSDLLELDVDGLSDAKLAAAMIDVRRSSPAWRPRSWR